MPYRDKHYLVWNLYFIVQSALNQVKDSFFFFFFPVFLILHKRCLREKIFTFFTTLVPIWVQYIMCTQSYTFHQAHKCGEILTPTEGRKEGDLIFLIPKHCTINETREHIDSITHDKQPVEWQGSTIMTGLAVPSLPVLHREHLVTSKPEIAIDGVPRHRDEEGNLVGHSFLLLFVT